MKSTYRLKTPYFVGFGREGHVRQEIVRYVTVQAIWEWENAPRPAPELVDQFMRAIDSPFDTIGAARAELSGCAIAEGLADAYAAARQRANDYLWACVQTHEPNAHPYREPDGSLCVPSDIADSIVLFACNGSGRPVQPAERADLLRNAMVDHGASAEVVS